MTAVRTSPAWPLQVALVAALAADAGIVALLDHARGLRIFDGLAPGGTPLPYVTIGDGTEGRADTFGRPGAAGRLRLHVWAPGPGRAAAVAIDTEIRRVLDGVRVAVTGHTMVRGVLTLTASFVDPDGATHHRVLDYETTTLVAL